MQLVLSVLVCPWPDVSTRKLRPNAIIFEGWSSHSNFIHVYPNKTLNSVGISRVRKTQVPDL